MEFMVNPTTSRLVQIWHNIVALPAQADTQYGNSASLNAQFWLGHFPWRPTAAWAVVGALLAGGALTQWETINWQTVALVVLLADPLWGCIWRLAAGRKELLPLDTQAMHYQVWLPYLQPHSPAHKLMRWDSADVTPLLFRVALPSLVLALAVALVLGAFAVVLTGAVALICVLGWTSRRSLGVQPVLLQSLVTVALPWLLALQQIFGALDAQWLTPAVVLALLLTVHHWAEGRLLRNHHDWVGAGLLALAEVGIVILFVVLQAPLWLGLLIVLWLPAWLILYQRQPLQRVNLWWLVALLVAALGVSSG
jgi:hypothetical protein